MCTYALSITHSLYIHCYILITYYNINGNKGIIKNEIKLKMKLYQSGTKHGKKYIFMWWLSTFILIFLLFFVQLLHYFIMKFSSLSLCLSWFSYFFFIIIEISFKFFTCSIFDFSIFFINYFLFLFLSNYFFKPLQQSYYFNPDILFLS